MYNDPYDRLFYFALFLYRINAISWTTAEPFLYWTNVDPLRTYDARHHKAFK